MFNKNIEERRVTLGIKCNFTDLTEVASTPKSCKYFIETEMETKITLALTYYDAYYDLMRIITSSVVSREVGEPQIFLRTKLYIYCSSFCF